MKGLGTLAELQARIVSLERDVTELGSVLDELQTEELPDPPDAPHPTSPPPAPPATHASDDGHKDGDGDVEPVVPFYGSLLEFVTEGFAPVYCRATSPTVRWCASWWDHAEALYRLEALWRSWELYRLEPRLGIASWLRDYLDPQLSVLTSATGPFAQCTDDRHSPVKPLRTDPPPAHYFDDL